MGGGGKSQQSSQSAATDPRIVQAYLDNLERSRSTAGVLGPRQFAPTSPTFTAGANLLGTTVGGSGMDSTRASAEALRGMMGMTPNTITAGNFLQGNIGAYMNPYTSQVVDQAMMDLDRQRQIQMGERAAQAQAAGAFGGSRHGVAEAETARAFADQMARTSAGLRSEAFDVGAGLMQRDIDRSMAAQVANLEAQFAAAGLDQQTARQLAEVGAQEQRMGLEGAQAMMNLGLLEQQITQEQLDAIRNLPLEQQRFVNEALGLYPPGGGGTSTSSGSSAYFNILGGGGSGGQSSDRRLKENIVFLGKEPKTGLPWYEFSYIGDDRRFQGVMADEVEEVYPEAVTIMENGYKGVRYGALGIEMVEVPQNSV